VAVSPDGHSVYVASGGSNAIAIFDRDTATGELTQKQGMDGCISEGRRGVRGRAIRRVCRLEHGGTDIAVSGN
jgi:DNA-binding beta-propeller fold protein YncE